MEITADGSQAVDDEEVIEGIQGPAEETGQYCRPVLGGGGGDRLRSCGAHCISGAPRPAQGPVTGEVRLVTLFSVADVPDRHGAVVRNVHRAIFGYGNTYRRTPLLAIGQYKAGQEIFVDAVRFSVLERHAYHFAAGTRGPVPGAVLGSKQIAFILLRKLIAFVESQAERSAVWLNQNVGNDRFAHEFRRRARFAGIRVVADVEPRPAIEPAFLDRSDVVRHQVVAEFVA